MQFRTISATYRCLPSKVKIRHGVINVASGAVVNEQRRLCAFVNFPPMTDSMILTVQIPFNQRLIGKDKARIMDSIASSKIYEDRAR